MDLIEGEVEWSEFSGRLLGGHPFEFVDEREECCELVAGDVVTRGEGGPGFAIAESNDEV